MGDIIELRLCGFEPPVRYKIPEEGMWFDLKCENSAVVALSDTPVGWFHCMIGFRNPGSISMKERGRPTHVTGLPFTLSDNKYTRFWFARKNKELWVGMGHNPKQLITLSITRALKYVTFAVPAGPHEFERFRTTFRFAVPPLRLKMPKQRLPKILDGDLQWKRCEDQLPDGSVIGGHLDGECVYVVRASHRSSLTPGYFIPSKGVAYIPWGGQANLVTDFEALCGYNYEWKRAAENKIPVSAFVAGYSEVNREPLYIGRCLEKNVPGKVQQSHKVCYVAVGDREVAVKEFEVLTVPGLNIHCVHVFYGHLEQSFNIFQPVPDGEESEEEEGSFNGDDDVEDEEEAVAYAF